MNQKHREHINNRTIYYYRWWRNEVLTRDKYVCQNCKELSGFLDVHHISPYAEDVNKRFNPDNGITLCPLCHGKRHGRPKGFIRERKEAVLEALLGDDQVQTIYLEWIEEAMRKKPVKPEKVFKNTLHKAHGTYMENQSKHIERFHTPEGHVVEWSKEYKEFREWTRISGGLISKPYTGLISKSRKEVKT